MALHRAKSGEIPSGAKVLERNEAYKHLYSEIYKHQPTSDVWALKYGAGALGVFASLSGAMILKHFRRQVGLTTEALFSSNLPCALIPCLGSYLCHVKFILPPIVLQEPYCEICLQLKAGCAHLLTGLVWPYALGFTSAVLTATKVGSYFPPFYAKEFWHISVKLACSSKGPPMLAGLLVLHVFGAMVIVYNEGMQIFTFNKRLKIREEIAKMNE